MEDFDQLTKGWKTISTDAAIENRKLFNQKNTSIMESILAYEKNEKSEKQKQVTYAIISMLLLGSGIAFWVLTGKFEIGIYNLLGMLILVLAFAFSIISNKTDDFPDARQMDSLSYLTQLKDNVISRRKRHIKNSFIAIVFVLPGLYLLFHNLTIEYLPTYVLLISALAGFIGAMYMWRKTYDDTTKPLINEIDVLLKQI